MFKVLVIAYYFPPMGLSGVQRTLKFVKYLKNYNWEPTVITTGDVGYFAYDEYLNKELDETDVRVIRTEGRNPNSLLSKFGKKKLSREIFRKAFSMLSQTFFIPDRKINWAKKALAKAEELLKNENFDAIFVTGPPFSSFHVFSQIKKKYHISLIIDYRDLWYTSYFAFYPTPFHKSINKKMEYNALKTADRIIVTNRQIKEKLLNTYQFLTFNDVVIITHGFDPDDFEKAKVIPKHNKRMILTYSGIFMVYNTPEYFLKAFKQISIEQPETAKNIELHFVGFLRKENQRLVKKLNLQEFVFDHGYVDHQHAVSKIISSDVLWMMVRNRQNIDAILPGKVYEYIGAKKPIIACVPEGAAKMAVQEYPASYICKPDDINEIKNTILTVYEHYKSSKFSYPEKDYFIKFRRDYLTEKLSKEFQFLIKADIR
jgi:glycosyltransferase involved in cell wall biosynthesis